MSCEICHHRKEKRFCLAIHGRICPQCCGQQREVTLDCPSECPYLVQARQHEKPRPSSELPTSEMFPQVEIEEPFLENNEHLITGLMATIAGVTRSNHSLKDREVLAALGLATRYYQTLAGCPGHSATVLVALALTGGIPTKSRAGNEIKLPPPATELMPPAMTAAKNRNPACEMCIERELR